MKSRLSLNLHKCVRCWPITFQITRTHCSFHTDETHTCPHKSPLLENRWPCIMFPWVTQAEAFGPGAAAQLNSSHLHSVCVLLRIRCPRKAEQTPNSEWLCHWAIQAGFAPPFLLLQFHSPFSLWQTCQQTAGEPVSASNGISKGQASGDINWQTMVAQEGLILRAKMLLIIP